MTIYTDLDAATLGIHAHAILDGAKNVARVIVTPTGVFAQAWGAAMVTAESAEAAINRLTGASTHDQGAVRVMTRMQEALTQHLDLPWGHRLEHAGFTVLTVV